MIAATVGPAFLAGFGLGLMYLLALWLSIRRLGRSSRPVVHLLGGAALRLGGLLGVVHLVADGRWERLLACLAGIVAARLLATSWASGPRSAGPAGLIRGGGDANHAG